MMYSRIHTITRHVSSRSVDRALNLSGIMPPIPTPFNKDESIAYDKLKSNIQSWEKMPYAGYVVQGSNGEYPLLSNYERVEVVKKVRELIPRDKLLVAGSTCEGTGTTIELSNAMADVGANAVLVTTPCYFKSSMSDEALCRHFTTLADSSRVPVVLYNVPANTGIDMSAGLVARLAHHENIIGVKDSGGDISKITRIVKDTRHLGFQVIAGSTGFLLPSLLVGCVGGINGLANILGAEVCQLYKLFKEARLEEATALQLRLVTVNSLVTRELGVAGMKAALDMVGLYGGPCRQPLQPLTEQQAQRLREGFEQDGFTLKQ